jgi:hypothetical protein
METVYTHMNTIFSRYTSVYLLYLLSVICSGNVRDGRSDGTANGMSDKIETTATIRDRNGERCLSWYDHIR